MRDVYVAYAANCRLDASHAHLLAHEKIRDIEKLSLFEKMFAFSLVRRGSKAITVTEVELEYGNDVCDLLKKPGSPQLEARW
jgi:hypothetical protein